MQDLIPLPSPGPPIVVTPSGIVDRMALHGRSAKSFDTKDYFLFLLRILSTTWYITESYGLILRYLRVWCYFVYLACVQVYFGLHSYISTEPQCALDPWFILAYSYSVQHGPIYAFLAALKALKSFGVS